MSGYRDNTKAQKAGDIPLSKTLADNATLSQTVTPSHWIAANGNRPKSAHLYWRWPLPPSGK
jgi:hypothetical protein